MGEKLAGCITLMLGTLLSLQSSAAGAEGFSDDTKIDLTLKNFYQNRNFLGNNVAQGQAVEWVQFFTLDVRSGYTSGPLGFGVDMIGQLGIKLDGSPGTSGTQLLPPGSPDDVSRIDPAVKIKYSKTVLKVGDTVMNLPILRSDPGRAKLQTYEGATLTSQEIENLTLYAGQIRATSLRNSIDMDSNLTYGGAISDRFNYVGGEYHFNQNRTMIGLWNAQLKDIYQQQFINLTHTQPLGDWVLGSNVGVFFGKDDGSARAGDLDNKTITGLFSAKYGMHTFYVGLQKVGGNSSWMRVGATDGTSGGGSLANDNLNSSFDREDERSWQLRYDLDFAQMGVPGLTVSNRYIRGDNVRVRDSGIGNGTESERELFISYTVQSGSFKNLNVVWKNSTARHSWRTSSTSDFDDNRLFISYPISLL
ncbi:OprD family porin [Pseudomonas sp. TH31]|nr:OprD family porin [Pseudomonas sp. TH31]